MIDPPEVPERGRAHPRRDRGRRDRADPRARPRTVSIRSCGCTPPTTSSSSSTRTRAGARRPNADEHAEAVPYARPIRGQPFDSPRHPIAALGWYSHDNDAILAGTWAAAVGAVDVTMSALARGGRAGRRRAAYALARPPGHHAATDSYAGYCFLNNAAIAAAAWAERGARVAMLDVDYHHGNGTQQIFYDRGDVCFVSLHADPAYEYPFFSGFTAEHGDRPRRRHHAQLPAPARHRVGHVRPGARRRAHGVIRASAPDALVVSLGVDTAAEDYDTFQLGADDFTRIGRRDRRARPPDASSCRRAATTSA